MNRLQRFFASSLMILFPLTGCARETQTPDITVQGNGSISFYFADQNLQCSFPFGGVAKFVESPRGGSEYCKHLKGGGYFKLTNVPSASTIWLVNGRPDTGQLPSSPKRCSKLPMEFMSFNWWKLTTIKQPTSMIDKVRIEDLKTKQVGDVIVPGVRLTEKYDSGIGPSEPDTINCAIMEISP